VVQKFQLAVIEKRRIVLTSVSGFGILYLLRVQADAFVRCAIRGEVQIGTPQQGDRLTTSSHLQPGSPFFYAHFYDHQDTKTLRTLNRYNVLS
jgi:hypothetical protein